MGGEALELESEFQGRENAAESNPRPCEECLGTWTCGAHGPYRKFESPLRRGCLVSFNAEGGYICLLFHFSFFIVGFSIVCS